MGGGEVLRRENTGPLQMQQDRFRPLIHNECCLTPTSQSSDITFDTVPCLTSILSAVPVTR